MEQRFVLDGIVGVVVLAGMAWFLYRPRVQQSERYQAMVVPLANIMDVGFLVLSPIIVVLVGYAAPLFMLGICLVAIATGFVIAYNIRHYEPLVGATGSGCTRSPPRRTGRCSAHRWSTSRTTRNC